MSDGFFSSRSGGGISSFSSFALDEPSCLVPVRTGFYTAIYEFSQGSFPRTIWEHGFSDFSNVEAFKLFIVNAQVTSVTSSLVTRPCVICSSYDSNYYIAVYANMLDVQARGFSRRVSLVISHIDPEVIERCYYLYKDTLVDLMQKILEGPLRRFKTEIQDFSASLHYAMEKWPESESTLKFKAVELKHITDELGIEMKSQEHPEEKPVSYFTEINNDLRSMYSLSNLEDLTHDIEAVIESMPVTVLSCNVLSLTNHVIEPPGIYFGGVSSDQGFPEFMVSRLSPDLELESPSLRQLEEDKVLNHILFTILSGKTLIILTEVIEAGESLAKRLSALVPFLRPDGVQTISSPTLSEILSRSIIVSKPSFRRPANSPMSVLDIDQRFYDGNGCPPSSKLVTELCNCPKLSEGSFILSMYAKLRKIASAFISSLSSSKSTRKLCDIARECGLSKDDRPILRYLIAEATNSHSQRLVLTKNSSVSGEIYTTF